MQLSATHETEEATMLLAYAVGGATDTTLIPKTYTWEGLCDRLMSPRVGNKDGSYYIRGGKLKANKRADENLLEAELLILDVDSTFDPNTGEISPGGPPLQDVAATLSMMGFTFVAHTSHSARPQDGFWKYRIVFPAKLKSVEELSDCLDYIIALLHGEGIYIADVVEARRWSQPWFLPRVRTEEDKAHFLAIRNDGLPFDVVAALEWAQERRKADAAIHAARTTQSQPAQQASSFTAFNDQCSLDDVRNILEGAGYRFGYFDRRQQSYRYMRPGSESKTCGVVVFKGSQGHWCTYSHHGNADPLSGRVCDPFDLVTALQYGGDRKAAARALIPRSAPEPSIVEQIAARQVEGETRPVTSVSKGETFILPPATTVTSEQTKNDFILEHWAKMRDVDARWLVKDIIPSGGFAALFGKPGSYKSFVALYLAAMIASGREAFGKDVEQGAVIYVAGEGGHGMRSRMQAIQKTHELDENAPIYFLRRQVNLRSTLDDATKLVEAVRALNTPVTLVVIDTLARAFAGGNENASEDMGAFMAIVAEVQRQLSCAAMIVHHSGKDEARGMRGHSSLFGAIDAELEVVKVSPEGSEDRIGQMTTTKQKDGEDNLKFTYRLEVVSLSDIDPEAVSLVVAPMSDQEVEKSGLKEKKRRKRQLSAGTLKVLEALRDMIKAEGDHVALPGIPAEAKCVRETLWKAKYFSSSPLDKDSTQKAYNRGKTSLWDTGTICGSGGYVWISEG